MAKVTVLVCDCGMRLKAAGAVPGRLGKCPACGAWLRVPGEPPVPAEGPTVPNPGPAPTRPSAYASAPARPDPSPKTPARTNAGNGVLRVPAHLETRLRDSLLYPLWGETGVALLVFLPPVLWFASMPLLTLALSGGRGGLVPQLAGLLCLLPTGLTFLVAGSYTLLYLGRVLATSALGDVHHPRWPDWDPVEMFRGLGRWIWALLVGGVLGGFPSVAYWMYCGDIDPFDAVILAELVGLGAVYGEVALLASILHDDPMGAHPATVVRGILRVGWGWAVPSLVAGTFATLAFGALTAVVQLDNPPLAAFAYWAYWVFLLYGTMVVLRVLGLCYHRHARALGWFRDRPRWGA